ncbi:hypothetical protein ACFE04_022083 [Oxalis oulophora]
MTTALEGRNTVDQLFFHDPNGCMVHICNCQNLNVLLLSSCPIKLSNVVEKANVQFPNQTPKACSKRRNNNWIISENIQIFLAYWGYQHALTCQGLDTSCMKSWRPNTRSTRDTNLL